MSLRPRCWQCKTILDLELGRPIGRSETCPECDADMRSCRACAHWDQRQRTCREPTAEVPADAERRNFCSAFQLAGPTVDAEAEAPPSAAEAAKKRLDDLFRKG